MCLGVEIDGASASVTVLADLGPERAFLLSFFFQAEDGIRDWSVTGVQTCALPIFRLELDADEGIELQAQLFRVDHQAQVIPRAGLERGEPLLLGRRRRRDHENRRVPGRSEEHTSELQSLTNLVCRLLLEKKKKKQR